jgi:precorrin-2/cobalt-factor-2 C20-methyltransferase
MFMSGILYGAGVGPGDPELMTVKAVRLIRENEVIAVPGKVAEETVAYQIAVQAVPELAQKTLVAIDMPMVHDLEVQDRAHEHAADILEAYLKQGKNVVYLTLGDPTIYSTYLYIQKKLQRRGYQAELCPGIPSFCAAAARTGTPLVEWDEQLHIVPAVHRLDTPLDLPGNYVLMKSGKKMGTVRQKLVESGRDVVMVENCGMENERVYMNIDEVPEESGYFSLIIAKEKKGE